MRIVIVGAKERNTDEDRKLVEELIDLCAVTYSNPMFITMLTFDGVGSFVKQKCLQKDSLGRYKHQLAECIVKLYASNQSKAEAAAIYLARNAPCFELGDIFYYFASADRRGSIEVMIEKQLIPSGRPYKIFMPGDPVTLV